MGFTKWIWQKAINFGLVNINFNNNDNVDNELYKKLNKGLLIFFLSQITRI